MKKRALIILAGCVLLVGCKEKSDDPLLPFTEPTLHTAGPADNIPEIPVVTSSTDVLWGTPSPTDTPTPKPTPTASPAPIATPSPTAAATAEPTPDPTIDATARPTKRPTPRPSPTPYFVPIQP